METIRKQDVNRCCSRWQCQSRRIGHATTGIRLNENEVHQDLKSVSGEPAKKKENYNKTLPSCNATLVLFSSALLTFQFIIFKKIKNKTKKKKINILPPPPSTVVLTFPFI